MARMSREFNLVLLGAGLLTAGSFLWPEDDPVKRADDEAAGGGGSGRYHSGRVFFVTYYTRTPTRSASPSGSAVRGGFGRIGSAFSGG